MDENPLDKKILILTAFFAFLIVCVSFVFPLFDGRTKIVFCDVGQGDAAYIRIKNQFDILIDAGPDRSVLDCLGKYMPFYDRKIELIITSHPQKDHIGGLLYVLDRYQVGEIFLTPLSDPSNTFQNFEKLIVTKRSMSILQLPVTSSIYWTIN